VIQSLMMLVLVSICYGSSMKIDEKWSTDYNVVLQCIQSENYERWYLKKEDCRSAPTY
jgi:hypothetical protein